MNFSVQWGLGEIYGQGSVQVLWVTSWFLKYLLNIISSSTSNNLWVTHWFLNDIIKHVFKLYKQ